MTAWDEFREVLVRLLDEQPGVLTGYPNPVGQDRKPPFSVRLVPWGAATAAELHRQFGDDVELTVGALPYPPGRPPRWPRVLGPPAELLSPEQATVELDGPAVVRSGHALQHRMLLHNRSVTT